MYGTIIFFLINKKNRPKKKSGNFVNDAQKKFERISGWSLEAILKLFNLPCFLMLEVLSLQHYNVKSPILYQKRNTIFDNCLLPPLRPRRTNPAYSLVRFCAKDGIFLEIF